jgi:hypothetical protein
VVSEYGTKKMDKDKVDIERRWIREGGIKKRRRIKRERIKRRIIISNCRNLKNVLISNSQESLCSILFLIHLIFYFYLFSVVIVGRCM